MNQLFNKSFFLVILLSGLVYGAEIQNTRKIKRGATMGLYPFPRVGRSGRNTLELEQEETGSNPAWTFDTDFPREMKRQGLIPFPRVGRSGNHQGSPADFVPSWILRSAQNTDLHKRGSGSTVANGGMWFGPRLGRVHKREVIGDFPWTIFAVRDFDNGADYSSHQGRESGEEVDLRYQNSVAEDQNSQ